MGFAFGELDEVVEFLEGVGDVVVHGFEEVEFEEGGAFLG